MVAAILASACGASSSPATSPTTPPVKVTLRLSFVHTGLEAPLTYGIQKGFFREQGIDLQLADGRGSATTIETVSNGSDDFGEVDGGTLLTLVTKGAAVKAVVGYVDGTVLAILTAEGSGINSPKDLEGRSLAITAGDAPSTILPALFDVNHVDKSKVRIVNMTPPAKLTALATHSADAVATLSLVAASLEARGVKVKTLLYSDFGVTTPGYFLIASNATIKNKPDLVRRFVAAAARSRAEAIKNPAAAIAAFHQYYPDYNPDIADREFHIILPLMDTQATRGKPSGYIARSDVVAGYDLLVKYAGLPAGRQPSDFYTDQFLAGK